MRPAFRPASGSRGLASSSAQPVGTWPASSGQRQARAALATGVAARTLSKHVLQYTGRSFRGANGTVAWPPHAPHTAVWYSRTLPAVRARFAAALQDGHRCGSLVRLLLAKKACSPPEKTNSSEQSRQDNTRSWNTLSSNLPRS